MAVWFSDLFNRSDESLGVSANWTERHGDWVVEDNHSQLSSGTGAPAIVAHIDTSVLEAADYYVQALCRWTSSPAAVGYNGVVGRRVDYSTSDSDGYFLIGWEPTETFEFYLRSSASWILLDSDAGTINQDQDYLVRFEAVGSDLVGKVDETSRVSATNAVLSAQGDVGLACGSGTVNNSAEQDNFEVGDFIPTSGGGSPKGIFGFNFHFGRLG